MSQRVFQIHRIDWFHQFFCLVLNHKKQTKEIATAESELSQLIADNDALYNSVISSVDLEKIKDKAMNELGMTYPQEDQIYQFDTAGNSYVRQYKDVPDTTK